MEIHQELMKSLEERVGLNKCGLRCLCWIMVGILLSGTVNLKRVSNHMSGGTKLLSKYRKLQRFFYLPQ
jgi:hypothetical protein